MAGPEVDIEATPDTQTKNLVLSANVAMRGVAANDPKDITVDSVNNAIVVPPGLPSVTINLAIAVPSGSSVKAIRFLPGASNQGVKLTEEYQYVSPFQAKLGPSGGDTQTVVLQDDTATPGTWSFGVLIGDVWYDPQIENKGSG